MDSKSASAELFSSHFSEAEIHRKNSFRIALFISLLFFLVISALTTPFWGLTTFVVVSVLSGLVFSGMYLYGMHRFQIFGKEDHLTVIGPVILAPGEVKRFWSFPEHAHTIPLEDTVNLSIKLPSGEGKTSQISVGVSYRINPNFITSPTLRHWSFVDFRDGLLHNDFLEVIKSSVEEKIIENYRYYVNQNYPISFVSLEDLAVIETNRHFISFFGEEMPISLRAYPVHVVPDYVLSRLKK